MTKSGQAITRMKRHIIPTIISAENYLLNEITKANQAPAVGRLNELVDHFMQIHKDDQYNKTKKKKKEQTVQASSMPETHHMHGSQTYMHTQKKDIVRQSANVTSDKFENKD